MARIFLTPDGGEIARRRARLPAGQLVEAWPDLYTPGLVWIGEASKARLDGTGDALKTVLSVDGDHVPIYYGPRLGDLSSLPSEESVRARVLSAHGTAAAWITLDQFGERVVHKAESPLEPVFFLRRPGGGSAHQWRLFRGRAEAILFMREHYGKDAEAQDWAGSLPADGYDDLLQRYAKFEDERRA